MTRRAREKVAWWLTTLACMCVPARSSGQLMTLREALNAASANDRAIQSAELQRAKAIEDLRIASGEHGCPQPKAGVCRRKRLLQYLQRANL